ncbi:MAG: sigma-70 family RNA polymerase sigma factor [Rudaea sp.]|nr:sigma-70 family RNA polymerase sigma factor [Rudaea sp.]
MHAVQNRASQDRAAQEPAASDRGVGFAQNVEAMTLARAQRGDMQAFATLYQCFGRPCFNLALRMLGDRQQAEDLVQEVFLKMMDTVGSYRGDAPFGAWLKRLAANACIDQLRRQRHGVEDDPEALFAHLTSDGPEAANMVDAWSLLGRLPPRARAVLVLHEFEGYTHSELAALFGQSESYSKSILARAIGRLNALVAASSLKQVLTCPHEN